MFPINVLLSDGETGWISRTCVVFFILLEVWLGYFVLVTAYRISPLHPLHSFPGPLLARATYLYEIYFDLYKGGQYTHQIKKLHERYGPLIRISPGELHCNDPHFIDEIYAGGSRKRNKSHFQVRHLIGPLRLSGFATEDHEVHRRRREGLRRFFSKAAVSRIERDLHGLAQQLGDKILATGGEVFVFQDAMSCFTSDGIGLHSFGDPLGFLRQHGFLPNLKRLSQPIFTTFYIFRWLGPARYIFARFGAYLSFIVPEEAILFKNLTDVEAPARILQVKAERESKVVRKRQTAFDALLESDLPEHEKSVNRLAGEANVFLIAGTDTTSWMLTVATYHLFQRPELAARLAAELRGVAPDPRDLPAWSALEQLPLLSAVVSEALRLGYGLAGRSPRIATHEDLEYRGTWVKRPPPGAGAEVVEEEVRLVVPRGWRVGMSTALVHHDEAIFPDSESFLPERWLDEQGRRRKDLERFLFSFSKGSRNCLGINLAYCELYLAMAVLVLRVYPRLRLYEATVDDVKFDRDHFMPLIKKGREGLRAFVVD